MRSYQNWKLAAIVGCGVWYGVVGGGIWAGLEPFTILQRATLSAAVAASLAALWLYLLYR